MFQDMASRLSESGSQPLSCGIQGIPVVSYPFAGFNIGGRELGCGYQSCHQENPDYLDGAALSGMRALGYRAFHVPTPPRLVFRLMTIPPIVRYFRDSTTRRRIPQRVDEISFPLTLKGFSSSPVTGSFPPPLSRGFFYGARSL
jgi:hypothetical protein